MNLNIWNTDRHVPNAITSVVIITVYYEVVEAIYFPCDKEFVINHGNQKAYKEDEVISWFYRDDLLDHVRKFRNSISKI